MRQLGVPTVLQAHAWAALGAMSLVDEPLCCTTVPLLVAELARNSAPAVRGNALLALSDIASQHTLLVDPHLKVRRAACLLAAHSVLHAPAHAHLPTVRR
jgi:hypothetical protein